MSTNVWLKCGRVYNLLSEDAPPSGDVTGPWVYKDSPLTTFHATLLGVGALSATVTIQVSADGVTAVSTVLGVITLSGTNTVADGFAATASWKYVRAVVSATTGTVTSVSVDMGV